MIINSGVGVLPPTVRGDQKPPSGQSPIEHPRSGFHGFLDAAIDTSYFTFNEIVEVGKNDPALALRYGATSISEKLLEGTGATVREGFGLAIIPTIRLSILGANAYRMTQTFKDPTAHKFEKGLDVLRVATDVVGLAGSVMKWVMPSKAALGDSLVGVSYAADSVSHSVRLMTHGVERVTVWKKQLAERKAAHRREPAKEVDIIAAAPVTTATPTYLMAK
jgi:hypothetical protein